MESRPLGKIRNVFFLIGIIKIIAEVVVMFFLALSSGYKYE